VAIVSIGLLIALGAVWPQLGFAGSSLLVLMSFTTLSFLITTPEVWVPNAGDMAYGFPFLAGPGRLVVKDAIMLGGAFVTLADSAKAYLRQRG
jgi:uncharacterized membrane protein YkgB